MNPVTPFSTVTLTLSRISHNRSVASAELFRADIQVSDPVVFAKTGGRALLSAFQSDTGDEGLLVVRPRRLVTENADAAISDWRLLDLTACRRLGPGGGELERSLADLLGAPYGESFIARLIDLSGVDPRENMRPDVTEFVDVYAEALVSCIAYDSESANVVLIANTVDLGNAMVSALLRALWTETSAAGETA